MSNGQGPVCQLKARTVVEGINEYKEKTGEDAIIRALNTRFPHGLSSAKKGLPLPNEFDITQAIMKTWTPGSTPGVCLVNHLALDPSSRILSPTDSKYSVYVFCQDDGWYAATPTCVEGLLVA